MMVVPETPNICIIFFLVHASQEDLKETLGVADRMIPTSSDHTFRKWLGQRLLLSLCSSRFLPMFRTLPAVNLGFN